MSCIAFIMDLHVNEEEAISKSIYPANPARLTGNHLSKPPST